MEPEKSHLDVLIRDLKKHGIKAVKDMVARKESEQFFIEFKLTENPDYSKRNKLYDSDRKNLAKAISGFGNSEGGLIIWGVDARQDVGGGNDFAKSIKLIKNPHNFKSLIESYINLLTLPAHKSVENILIKGPRGGIVVTVVPKSNDGPHQNINDKDSRYYMRAGDSFLPVPHGLLKGMFGQEPKPEIAWMFNVSSKVELIEAGIKFSIGLMGVNGGLGIAEDIYGHVRMWSPGDQCKIGVEFVDTTHYEYQQAYGVEFSFMSKPGFRLGYQQRTQMMVLTFVIAPPFTDDFHAELLIGARSQGVYKKDVSISPKKLAPLYDKHKGSPDGDFIEKFWDAPIKK